MVKSLVLEAAATACLLRYWEQSGDDREEKCDAFRIIRGFDSQPLSEYLSLLLVKCEADESTTVVAWVYLDRFVAASSFPVTKNTQHLLCLAVIVLAHMWTEDECFSARAYARFGCVSVESLHRLQAEVCAAIDWRLWVHPEQFISYRCSLRQLTGRGV